MDLVEFGLHGYLQIYDNNKMIWWQHVNASKAMTRDDFIESRHCLFGLKHKIES